jgi:heme/copper-type cytochrome/quinol oxidase subunit 4
MTDQSGRHRQDSLQSHRGRLILTLGVLSFVVAGVLTAIPAWVMGSGDLKKMDAGIMEPEGRALTMAGRILGKVCTILTIVILAIALLAIAFHAASGAR